ALPISSASQPMPARASRLGRAPLARPLQARSSRSPCTRTAPLSLRASLHCTGQVLHLKRLVQGIEGRLAAYRHGHALAGQDIEAIVRDVGIDISERDPHFARELVACKRQHIALIRSRSVGL